MLPKSILLQLSGWLLASPFAFAKDPTVTINTGTLIGRSLPEFNQDVYLGIPYAAKPERFTPATLLTTKSKEASEVKQYGASCPSYGSDTTVLLEKGMITLDEDCLNLNVIVPKGYEKKELPVLVWIYGGGWMQGTTADPRYNMSYIIEQSAEMGKPVIGVSMNYRLGGFGFLYGQDVLNSGNTNLGIRDQRVALEWVQKNIKAFGGDADKVTIWGESAGAFSVGNHLLAYGGRDDGLFRAAILQSGNAIGPPHNDTRWYQPLYDRITTTTGCYNATDTLQCLREVPYDSIYPAMNVGYEWFAVVDGNFVEQWPVLSLQQKKLIKVPLLLGTCTDEGTSFGVGGVDNDEEAVAQLITSKRWVVNTFQAQKVLSFYPDDPAVGSPFGTGNRTWPSLGLQYKRYSSIAGDITMDAPRRLLAETYSAKGVDQKVYSYRFDSPLQNTTSKVGVGHFSDIPYVFSNTDNKIITALGDDPSHVKLGHLMARMWASFVTDLDPNGHGVDGIAKWPDYRKGPNNFVFRNDTSYVEADTYRKEGMAYINSWLR
ncbi:uncharacterized protein LAJ45_03386 [Morchella importuna]|uniref:uncharacterized protein n=1 Tax=Morchella importuna TaxID=1174673 RepID=UPI001E8E5EFE|nr:uncharacterized protein LAJ45_03386 [Morchella importuna]KAH8152546.1 hypothetical protein LAJ45_03386 [Morchella importuna]